MWERMEILAKEFEEINRQLCDPEVISSPEKLKNLAKARADLQEKVELYRELKQLEKDLTEAQNLLSGEPDPEFTEFLQSELSNLTLKYEELSDRLQRLLLPPDPYADRDVIVEIRAGTGGEEAALFAADLLRMYLKYAEKKGWKSEIISASPTELGGYKEVIFSIAGKIVYSRMKFESGIHRVQRVPVTEASGRLHTSAVTVAVMPEPEEVDVQVNLQELRIDTFRASGAGGQHVNKTDSAVRITHLPTGLVVSCQDERSQHQNREKAMRILKARLLEQKMQAQEEEIVESRRMQVKSGDRSEKIRTYNYPQNRLTDHRLSKSFYNMDYMLDGNLEDLIDTLLEEESRRMLEEAAYKK